jgi:hypothetical protein
VVTVYKVATGRKIKGGGISIRSYTNRLNIEVIKKVFKGEVVIKQVLDY